MSDALFDHDAVLAGLHALAELLADRDVAHQTIVIVGGSYLAILGLREATRDIDTVTRIEAEMRRAIADVAVDKGYDPQWLNDTAVGFRPIGLMEAHCSTLYEHEALTVLGPSADWVFLMKLYAGRAVDHDDLIKLWPRCGFTSADDAVRRYWDAYPHAADDDYLVNYVREIARAAG